MLASEKKVDQYKKFYVHGTANCMELCESMVRGEISGCFIEMNMCAGGCIKGPTVNDESISRFKVKLKMEETIPKEAPDESKMTEMAEGLSFRKVFEDKSPDDPMPTEEQIQQILRMLEKINQKTN